MMKLNNRERNLLLILLIVIIGYVYMNYFYLPTREELSSLESEKLVKENELMLLETEISKKENYENLFQEYNDEIIDLSGNFYSEFYQEDFIVLLKGLAPEGLSINEFVFRLNDFDGLREQLEIDLTFEGEYLDLYEFINGVNDNKKNIVVNKLNIESEEDTKISGEMTVLVDRITDLSAWVEEESYFSQNGNLVEKQFENPFVPYASLAEKYNKSDDEMSKIELYLVNREVTPISAFNTSELFFVGTDIETYGEIFYSKKRLYGNHSIGFDYDFGIKRKGTEANVVFRENLVIEEPSDFISMWVYSDYITGHEIGLVLVDAHGVSHDITLTSNVDFKDWKVLETEIPLEVNFPSKVQRIYVRSSDNDQRLSGELLFDQLQLANEKEVAEEE